MPQSKFTPAEAEELAGAFAGEEVDYLFIGTSGAILLGYPDTTQDVDIFLPSSRRNAERVLRALRALGFELDAALTISILSSSEIMLLKNGPFAQQAPRSTAGLHGLPVAVFCSVRIVATRSMGEAFVATDEWESALEYSRKALALYERLEQTGSEGISLMRTHDTIGGVLSHMGNQEEAIRSYRKAVELGSEPLPKGHYAIALSKGALGEVLTTQKRFSEAETLLPQSYESLEASQGAKNPRTRLALERLVALYDGWSRPDTANAYRNKLASKGR